MDTLVKRRKCLTASGSALAKVPKRNIQPNRKSNKDIIPVHVSTCPNVNKDNHHSFDFKFKGKCPVRSCQFFTDVTSRNCLLLDTRMPSTSFSDPQIFYYKIQKNDTIPAEQKPKPRTINLLRKKAVISIQANIIFYYFVDYLLEKYCPEDSNLIYRKGLNNNLDSVVSSFPFVQEGLTHFQHWMLPFLFDKKIYSDFLEWDQSLLITDQNINLQHVLGMTPVKFEKIQNIVSELNSVYQHQTLK